MGYVRSPTLSSSSDVSSVNSDIVGNTQCDAIGSSARTQTNHGTGEYLIAGRRSFPNADPHSLHKVLVLRNEGRPGLLLDALLPLHISRSGAGPYLSCKRLVNHAV